ncbi:MAG: hypothetical protein R6V14_00130 [Halanaerobiales bacterium]
MDILQHVIHNADKIKVNLDDLEKAVKAEVVWADYNLDLAIIQISVDHEL